MRALRREADCRPPYRGWKRLSLSGLTRGLCLAAVATAALPLGGCSYQLGSLWGKGKQDDAEVTGLYSRCRAVIVPGEEDFGLVPLEAMASGRPVVALARGGALETVQGLSDEAPTGVFFQGGAEDLAQALLELERHEARFEPARLRRYAARFDRPRFQANLQELLGEFRARFRAQ